MSQLIGNTFDKVWSIMVWSMMVLNKMLKVSPIHWYVQMLMFIDNIYAYIWPARNQSQQHVDCRMQSYIASSCVAGGRITYLRSDLFKHRVSRMIFVYRLSNHVNVSVNLDNPCQFLSFLIKLVTHWTPIIQVCL